MTVPQREGGAPLGEEETAPRVWKDRRMPALRKLPNIFSLSHQALLRVEISRSSSIWEGRSLVLEVGEVGVIGVIVR